MLLIKHGVREAPIVATIFHNLGGLEHARGRHARAERHARRSVRIRTADPSAPAVHLAADRAALAAILDARGEVREAERLYREAIAVFGARLGADHFEVGFNLGNLAALLQRRGQLRSAARLYARALQIKQRALGRHPDVATTLTNFGVLRAQQGRRADAEQLLLRAHRLFVATLGARHRDTIWCRDNRAALERGARHLR
jgi:Flp pilus assembly protein TadD